MQLAVCLTSPKNLKDTFTRLINKCNFSAIFGGSVLTLVARFYKNKTMRFKEANYSH
jgi:hypothetical protein